MIPPIMSPFNPVFRRSMAIFVAVAVILITLGLLWMDATTPSRRSNYSRVRADMRYLATAIESYRDDMGSCPAAAPFVEPNFPPRLTTFRNPTDEDGMGSITTPVSYITSLIVDVFAPSQPSFAYGPLFGAEDSPGWVMLSPGPDSVYDIRDFKVLIDDDGNLRGDFVLRNTYDPTNGETSIGDILWFGEARGTEGGSD